MSPCLTKISFFFFKNYLLIKEVKSLDVRKVLKKLLFEAVSYSPSHSPDLKLIVYPRLAFEMESVDPG